MMNPNQSRMSSVLHSHKNDLLTGVSVVTNAGRVVAAVSLCLFADGSRLPRGAERQVSMIRRKQLLSNAPRRAEPSFVLNTCYEPCRVQGRDCRELIPFAVHISGPCCLVTGPMADVGGTSLQTLLLYSAGWPGQRNKSQRPTCLRLCCANLVPIG